MSLHALWEAAQQGRTADVVLLAPRVYKRYGNLQGSAKRKSPLIVAALNDHADVVAALLAARACVQADFYSRLPLFAAAAAGSCNALRALLEAKVAVNGTEHHSALTPAIRGSHHLAAELLLQAKIDVNKQTSLCDAAKLGDSDAVRLLLVHKARADGRRNLRPLRAAVSARHADSARLLLQAGADISVPRLWHAYASSNMPDCLDTIRVILDAKTDINTPDFTGYMLPEVVVQRGQTRMLRLLVERNADMNTVYRGLSLLNIASRLCDPSTVQCLLAFKAQPDVYGKPAVALAARRQNTRIARHLLGAKGDPNQTFGRVPDPLESAIRGENAALVNVLLDAKADFRHQQTRDALDEHLSKHTVDEETLDVQRLLHVCATSKKKPG